MNYRLNPRAFVALFLALASSWSLAQDNKEFKELEKINLPTSHVENVGLNAAELYAPRPGADPGPPLIYNLPIPNSPIQKTKLASKK